MNPTVCFCHGRESGPWGTKIRRLAGVAEQFGCRVVSRDDRASHDPDERVRRLLTDTGQLPAPLILVGSSMGGYVAAMAAQELRPLGLFLVAPAIGLPGYRCPAPAPVAGQLVIVHGWEDTVVPVANVLDFAGKQRAALHILADGHLLDHSLDQLARLFGDFLATCLGRTRPAAPSRELVASL